MNLCAIHTLPKFHILKVTNTPATNSKPAMVRIRSEMWNQSITVPYSNTAGSDIPKIETAINWCEENGFPVIGWENGNTHGFIVTSYNKPLK